MVWKPDYSKVPKVIRVLGFPIKIYDNGGKTFDQYTVVYCHKFTKTPIPGWPEKFDGYDFRGMSDNPFHPQGYGLYGEGVTPGIHLGKRINFKDLPVRCRECVKMDIKYFKKQMKKYGVKL